MTVITVRYDCRVCAAAFGRLCDVHGELAFSRCFTGGAELILIYPEVMAADAASGNNRHHIRFDRRRQGSGGRGIRRKNNGGKHEDNGDTSKNAFHHFLLFWLGADFNVVRVGSWWLSC